MAVGEIQGAAQENLRRAFVTFTQAAGSLENSHTQLQGEVARLHGELQRANSELERSMEENARVRAYLAAVVENLPCGVLVQAKSGRIRLVNPEAQRILPGTGPGPAPGPGGEAFARLVAQLPAEGFFSEQETSLPGNTSNRTIGILRTNISGGSEAAGDTLWIFRDITEQKRLAHEREAARNSVALAEIATVLAHEIRNPLGSLELFTGLLADATTHLPETRQWITHLQAGLRALAATTINLV